MAKDVLITPANGSIEIKNDANALKVKVVAEDITTSDKTLTLPNKTGTLAITTDVPNITGGASTIVSNNLTTNRALVSDGSGKVAVSNITTEKLGFLTDVTSNIQSQLNGTVKTSGNQTITGTKTFNSTISGSITGNAGTATTLQTSKTINVGTGVSGTATAFNGSSNITIPVTGVSEAYLTWGGKNLFESYGPIDAAMVNELGANRLAFYPENKILVEYSLDAGITWLDYEATPVEKINLFNGIGTALRIGKNTLTGIDYSNYQLRVTLTGTYGSLYTALNKFVMLISTNGSRGVWTTIEGRLQSNVEASVDTWEIFSNQTRISGWAGYNVINTNPFTTYGNSNSKSSQYGEVRFTFGGTGANTSYSGLEVRKILGFGGVGWTTPSNLAKYGNMYTYDSSQNTLFPAAVQGTRLISTIATGTSPLAVSSTTKVNNLNADLLDGKHANEWFTNPVFTGTTNIGSGSPTWTIDDATANTLTFKLGTTIKMTIGTASIHTPGAFSANGVISSGSSIQTQGYVEALEYIESWGDISSGGTVSGNLLRGGLEYSTTTPTSANTNGLKIYVGSTDPATKYAGWLYIIT